MRRGSTVEKSTLAIGFFSENQSWTNLKKEDTEICFRVLTVSYQKNVLLSDYIYIVIRFLFLFCGRDGPGTSSLLGRHSGAELHARHFHCILRLAKLPGWPPASGSPASTFPGTGILGACHHAWLISTYVVYITIHCFVLESDDFKIIHKLLSPTHSFTISYVLYSCL